MKYLALLALIVGLAGVVRFRHEAQEAARPPRCERIATISTGERVELTEHLAPNGWTVVEFGAAWCPGCRALAPKVEAIVEAHEKLHLRKIDIGSWDSDVARQFGLRSIPQLYLFDGSSLVAQDLETVWAELQSLER